MVRAELDPKPLAGPDAHKRPDVTLVIGGAAALALLVALLVYFFWPWVHVPDVAGRSEREAIAALERVGFHWQRQEEPSETASPGSVIRTSPAAGQIVDKGASLTIVIAIPVRVPLQGGPLLSPGIHSTAPVEVAKVPVEVAAPVKIAVPSITGRSETDAAAALERLGLKWQRQEQPSETSPPGTVIGTSPAAEQMVAKGETVTLAVAVPIRVSVPPVVGQPEAQAAAALNRLGLEWQRQDQSSDRAAPGTVIGTSPLVGQMVDKGSTVTLVVGVPASVAVPPVVGQPVADATAALGRAGLKWQRQDQPNESTPAGRVINSSPPAGEISDKGAIVTLTVAVPVRVAVPRVIGQPVAGAIAALGRAGFKVQRQEEPTQRMAPGRVLSSSPAAGEAIEKGSTVTLAVAKAVAEVHRDTAVQPPSRPPSDVVTYPPSYQAAAPWTPEPPRPPSSTATVAPWAQGPPRPPSGMGSVAPPTSGQLSGDALLGHLYDNAHESGGR